MLMVDFDWTQIYIGLTALAVALIVLRKRNKSFWYLLFFSIFSIYMMGVISVVVFPFVIPESPPEFSQRLINPDFNVIPFSFGSCFEYLPDLCFRGIYENILLTIPFGFGISFILRIRSKNIIWLALAVGSIFEATQLIVLLVFGGSFRSVDINDVIFNATGVLLGYGLFRIFGTVYVFIAHKFQIQPRYIFAYIYDIVRHQN